MPQWKARLGSPGGSTLPSRRNSEFRPPDSARSALMGRVRQRSTAAELSVGQILRRLGASYRLNVTSLPGSPDFANKSRQWAVFVHGCFWHHHEGCRRATIPKTNSTAWITKFRTNQERDARAIRELRSCGFTVAIVWECELKDMQAVASRLLEVLETRSVDVR
ncbi:MAG: very short patch repair endonuclease [Devosia sp.]